MINFREELAKYEPVLEIGDIEDAVRSDEMKDIVDIFLQLTMKKDNFQKYDIDKE
ncbi:MAG: hypothetical protein KHZ62_09510 [Clostridiales bacterium]|nr:hypothetical protein [Clostridiales bacterium]